MTARRVLARAAATSSRGRAGARDASGGGGKQSRDRGSVGDGDRPRRPDPFQARAKGSREVAAAVNPAQRTREERKKRDGMSHFFIRQSRALLGAVKQTTGIVGLEPIADGRGALGAIVARVLTEVKTQIPEEAGYRKVVESVYRHRQKIIEEVEDPAQIEARIGCGQIEELVAQAKDELRLIPKMAETKPWEFDHAIKSIAPQGKTLDE